MRVASLGGGPAGLYFAISLKLRQPDADITVFERNKPDDTFGWGVVLSDETLDNLRENDPISADTIRESFAYWDDIAVHYRGTRQLSTGHGFCGIGRKQLLLLLQARARELGIRLEFEHNVDSVKEFAKDYDLVVASDGLNSATRTEFADTFKPDIDMRACKFVWLGTHQKFDDAFTFIFEETDKGWLWAHAYQFNDDTATFIVETDEDTWNAYGFGEKSQEESIAICEEVFKDHLDGHSLMTNANHIRGSAWINFPRVLCETWHHDNIVLMGDASATAHFSIGSGSKLALESAIALAEYVTEKATLSEAFELYQDERRVEVLRLQSAARNSLEWFEDVERYLHLDPVQFNYSLLTRSQRISHENLRLRDPEWLESAEKWFQTRAGGPESPVRAPMFAPYRLRDMALENRVVVSPMAQYKAVDGCPTDWHFIHYAERAKGGAGLVYTEMTCTSADGRITPGCPGLYALEHEAAWKRLNDFVHAETSAKLCCQIGHAGRKASAAKPWDGGAHLKNDEGGWPIVGPSDVAFDPDGTRLWKTPAQMSVADIAEMQALFVAAAKRALAAGYKLLEIHGAHGYLLHSFFTPLVNTRDDQYGGELRNRARMMLETVDAVRAVWPENLPLSVRLSVSDWTEGGLTITDNIQMAKWLKERGVDFVDCSGGGATPAARASIGSRTADQVTLCGQLRAEVDIATMAVGTITEAKQADALIADGTADMVLLARGMMRDPYWAMHAAQELGVEVKAHIPVQYGFYMG